MEWNHKILFIDDETEYLNDFATFFRKRDFEVDTASSGEEGLEKLRTGNFEVAIVDISMPDIDGITLAKHVYDEDIDTDIIILTGYGDRNDAIRAIKYGVGDWFDKGKVTKRELLNRAEDLAQIIPLSEMRKIFSDIPDMESVV